ncbi:MAG TPA: heat-inducible transcriptional repressor HrcA [Gammaproteobacteria bacterium]
MRSTEGQLSDRARQLLTTLVERYIRDGEPVGSRTLSRDSGLDLSPATIRNIMADLEELGMVRSPHTSAGRVPTARGYRLFVDALLTVKPLDGREVARLQRELLEKMEPARGDSQSLMTTTSSLLSGVTQMAGLVTIPKRDFGAWRQVEFLPLSDNRVLAILVVNEREVQNRILELDRAYSQSELQQFANYLNTHFAGRDVGQIRASLLKELRNTRESMNDMMAAAITMAEQMFERAPPDEDYVLAGETHLMEFAELSNVDKLRQLFEAFNKKREILHLLDQCVAADGVQIFIGEESGYQVLDECSVVTAPYRVNEELVGVLGVIGPTRMAYERVIPIVDMTAKLLSAALNPRK